MINTVASTLPFLILLSNIMMVVFFLALLGKASWGQGLVKWVGKHALVLGFWMSFSAVLGSLFYSNVMNFLPCILCWWQRIAIYPLVVLFTVALKKQDRGVFSYVLPLSLMALVISTYHSYVQWGGSPLIPCSATATCTKIYVDAFGYITIPTMVLSISIAFLLLYWANKIYENRHA
jgi:disulfide bond formation protein DsbB